MTSTSSHLADRLRVNAQRCRRLLEGNRARASPPLPSGARYLDPPVNQATCTAQPSEGASGPPRPNSPTRCGEIASVRGRKRNAQPLMLSGPLVGNSAMNGAASGGNMKLSTGEAVRIRRLAIGSHSEPNPSANRCLRDAGGMVHARCSKCGEQLSSVNPEGGHRQPIF